MIIFLIILLMILPPEYNWLESYLNNDMLWLEESLNWEEAFDLALSDLNIFSSLITSFFFNSQFFIDSLIKLSFLDVIFVTESNKQIFTKELFNFFIWDLINSIYIKFLPLQIIFYTDYQDYLTILLYYSPELILALNDYINSYWINNVLNYLPAAGFDLFSDTANLAISEFMEYFILIFFFFWILIIFISVFSILKWNNPVENYFIRLYYYAYSTSRETRIQFETMLMVFFFFFFYWTMMIATFDDDQEEIIEMFDVSCFSFFCLLIIYLFFKYSQHYFAFLEASVTEGRNASFIAKQFFRDFINTFALFLRFFILLFRLNVYDTLDDFYDSYYIFLGDFDEDEYFSELFFSINSALFYDYDINDDRIYSLEEEHDFFFDLFYIYFLCWGKLFTFIFFILEEILRLSLAFYICYLITFEVHSVNCSYIEDNYFFYKKQNFNNNKSNHASFKL